MKQFILLLFLPCLAFSHQFTLINETGKMLYAEYKPSKVPSVQEEQDSLIAIKPKTKLILNNMPASDQLILYIAGSNKPFPFSGKFFEHFCVAKLVIIKNEIAITDIHCTEDPTIKAWVSGVTGNITKIQIPTKKTDLYLIQEAP